MLPRDGGTDAAVDAPTPTVRALEFDPNDDLQLEPGQTSTLRVRLRDRDGTPVANEEVRFALVGEAADATINSTRALTTGRSASDPEAGFAAVQLTAPSRGPLVFRVRASAPGAPETYRSVSVSAQGFGALALSVRYAGTRGPDHLMVGLYPGATCSQIDRIEPVRSVRVDPAGATVNFGALAVGVPVAVRGTAVGASGDVLARGCVDAIEVSRDESTRATLPLEDLALTVQGGYRLDAALDLSVLTAPAAVAWVSAVESAAPDGDERLLLAAVADAVETRAGRPERDAFERTWGRLLPAVQADLTRRNASPTRVLTRLATDVAAILRSADLTLALAGETQSGVGVLTVREANVRLDPLTPDVERDDALLALPTGGTGTAVPGFGDRLSVRFTGVPVPFASLARRANDALLSRLGVTSSTEWALLNARCADFGTLVAPYAPPCDTSCAAAACETVVSSLTAALSRAMERYGAAYTRVEFAFDTTARGRAGSLRIESAESAPLAGFFEGDSEALFVGAALLRSP